MRIVYSENGNPKEKKTGLVKQTMMPGGDVIDGAKPKSSATGGKNEGKDKVAAPEAAREDHKAVKRYDAVDGGIKPEAKKTNHKNAEGVGRCRSKSDVPKLTDALQRVVINPQFPNGNVGMIKTESRRKSDFDQLTDGVLKLSIANPGEKTMVLKPRGPLGGRGANYRHDEYNRAAANQQKLAFSGFDAGGKRSRDHDGLPDYKFTKPDHNGSSLPQFEANPGMFMSHMFSAGDVMIDQKPAHQLSTEPGRYNVCWQNDDCGNLAVNLDDGPVLVPDVDENLDELYKLLADDDLPDTVPATNQIYDAKNSHIRRTSGDDGIDMVYSPNSIVNLSSPDSGLGSPEGVSSPMSPHAMKATEQFKQLKSPAQYRNASPQQMVGSPGHMIQSPQQMIGSPGHMIQSPQQMISSPGHMIQSPQQMIGSPGHMIQSPQQMIGSPGHMIQSPQQMIGSPGHMIQSPQQMIGSPGHMIQSPQQMVCNPQDLIGSPQRLGSPNQMLASTHMKGNQTKMLASPSQMMRNTGNSAAQSPLLNGHLKGRQFLMNDGNQGLLQRSNQRTQAVTKIPPQLISNPPSQNVPKRSTYNGHESSAGVLGEVIDLVPDCGLDMFFNTNVEFLNDVNTTIVDDLMENDGVDTIKKLLESDEPVPTFSVKSTPQNAHMDKNIPVAEIEDVMQKSRNTSASSLNYKFDVFNYEDCNDGSVSPDMSDFIDSITQPENCNQPYGVVPNGAIPQNPAQMCNGLAEIPNNYASNEPIVVRQPQTAGNSIQTIQAQMPPIQSNMFNDPPQPAMSQVLSTVTGVSSVRPILINGQQQFVVAQSSPQNISQPLIIGSQLPSQQVIAQVGQQPQPIITQLTQTQPIVAAGSVITSPIGPMTSSNQFVFLLPSNTPGSVGVTSGNKSPTDATQNQKLKKLAAKAPRKILPKSPPVMPQSTSMPPITMTSVAPTRRPSPTCQPTPIKPAINGCLNVSNTNKLNIARRCVANMTREDLQYKDSDGDTYLHVAVCRTDPHLVQAMLERIQREGLLDLVDAQNSKRQTPLYLAVAANQPVMVRLFVKCGADVNSMTQAILPDGMMEVKAAIHCAASGCDAYLNTLRELIHAKDINLNLANSEGLTALHCAILEHGRHRGDNCTSSIQAVQLLIRSGADPNVQDKCSGKTPLMYAIQTLDYALVESIVSTIDKQELHKMIKTQTFDGSTCTRIASGLHIIDRTDMDNWKKITGFLMSAAQNMSSLVNQNCSWLQRVC